MAANQKIYEDRSLRLASHRNVMFSVWTDAPTLPQVRTIHREGEIFVRANPTGQALVNIVVGGIPLFTDAVREELVKMMRSRAMFSLGTAHVILVGGMAGSAVRAFLSTVMLLARPPAPNRVFGTAVETVAWLHGRLGGTAAQWTANELRDALEDARRGREPAH